MHRWNESGNLSRGPPLTCIRRPTGRAALLVASVAAIFLGSASPAAADPAEPSNFLSSVTSLDPQSGDMSVEVVGGDAFLVIRVAPGHELLIPGYRGEPYVRIDADSSVWVNLDSPTLYINEERFARADVPADADGEGEPRWDLVGTDGQYAWHDHRTHWMSFDPPPTVAGGTRQVVFPWTIPVELDGKTINIAGQLEWIPSRNPVLPAILGLIALIPLLAFNPRKVVGAILITAAGLAGALLGFAEAAGTPETARSIPTTVVFPTLAVVVGAMGITLRRRPDVTRWALLAGGLLLGTWAISSLEVLWLPVLISSAPAGVERASVAAVAWVALGALALWAVAFVERLRTPG